MVSKRRMASLSILIGLFAAGSAVAQDIGVSGSESKPLRAQPATAERRISGLEAVLTHPASDTARIDGEIPTGTAATAQDSDLLKRLERLEEEWKALKKAVEERVENGHPNSKMSLHGRIHFDHWAFPGSDTGIDALEDPARGPQDRFAFRRVRIGVKGDIGGHMVYRITMEFANPSSVQYRDVYFGVTGLPFFRQVLIGNQKRPYSLDQLNSSNANVFIERPFIADAIQQDTRRIGIQSWSVSANQVWNWQYGIFNRENTQDDGSYISDHYQSEAAARLASTFYYDEQMDGRGYGHGGIAVSYGHPDEDGDPAANTGRFRARPEARSTNRWLETGAISGAQDVYLLGLEGVLNIDRFQLAGETMHIRVGRDPGPATQFWGAYGYAAYFLTDDYIPWDRKTGTLGKITPRRNAGAGWGAWQVAARYSFADFNDEDILGGEGKSVTLGLNWWWNPNARLQLNYIHGSIDGRSVGLTGSASGDYDILGTRFMVFF